MISYPVVVVDNFFDDPDKVRQLALSMDYTPDERGTYPAVRSEKLHINHPAFFDSVCRKILSLYYDLSYQGNINWKVNMSFQKVNKSFKSGWIHMDSPAVMSCIIYLNPNPAPNSGTSIYRLKKDVLVHDRSFNDAKEQAYLGNIPMENVEEARLANNNQYDEVIKVHNSYNRLVAFDASVPHGALDFFGKDDEDTRLTLAVFFHELVVGTTPIGRLKAIW